jgi:hypothetical protein
MGAVFFEGYERQFWRKTGKKGMEMGEPVTILQ